MQTTPISVLGQQGAQNPTGHDAFSEVNLDEFLGLLLAEMQNQDPLEPMDNQEILQQISQIREIESNARLTETLEAVRLGQAMSTASSLIGRWIEALAADGTRVAGLVERVSVVDGKPKLHVEGREIDLENVAQILAEPGGSAESGAT
jgi:flagellar basal-body rod modification protein FlgD